MCMYVSSFLNWKSSKKYTLDGFPESICNFLKQTLKCSEHWTRQKDYMWWLLKSAGFSWLYVMPGNGPQMWLKIISVGFPVQ